MKTLIKFTILTLALTFGFANAEEEPAIPERGGEGTVSILIDPPGATVYLGGEELGKTPIKNVKFKSGRHDLTVIDQEQELISTRFNVWPGKHNEYAGKTVMPFGSLKLDAPSRYKNCNVYINEELAGKVGAGVNVGRLDVGDNVLKLDCRKKYDIVVPIEGEKTTYIKFDGKKLSITETK